MASRALASLALLLSCAQANGCVNEAAEKGLSAAKVYSDIGVALSAQDLARMDRDPEDSANMACSRMASLDSDPCSDLEMQNACAWACAVYSRIVTYDKMCPGEVHSEHVRRVRKVAKEYDVVFVTEGGDYLTEAAHMVIRVTSGFHEYSHALIISQVKPKIMVIEAVSNVDKYNEPSGIREVAVEYAMHKVTKFSVMRKGHFDLVHVAHHGQSPEWIQGKCDGEDHPIDDLKNGAMDWARSKEWAGYHTLDSWLSVFSTFNRDIGYNLDEENTPDKFYCSQFVAYIIYRQGCAFHSGTNLNVDPWELLQALSWTWGYSFVACSGTTQLFTDGGCDAEFDAASESTRESKGMQQLRLSNPPEFIEAVCKEGGNNDERTCPLVSVEDAGLPKCEWDSDSNACKSRLVRALAKNGEFAEELGKLEEDIARLK